MYKLTNTSGVLRITDGAYIPGDEANSDYIKYLDWVEAGGVPEPLDPPSDASRVARFQEITQGYMDHIARSRNYDGILSLCTYATSSVPQFQSEGQAGVEFRDACWKHCYDLWEKVQSGEEDVPGEVAFLESLPDINW